MAKIERPSAYVAGAVVLLVAAAAFELARIVLNEPWNGFVPAMSHTASATLATVWLATAASLLALRSARGVFSWSGVMLIGAVILMMSHAFITRVAGTPPGMLYVLVAAAIGFLGKRALGGRRRVRPTSTGARLPAR